MHITWLLKSEMTDKISENYKIVRRKNFSEKFGTPEDIANAVLFYRLAYLITLQGKLYMLMEECILVDKII